MEHDLPVLTRRAFLRTSLMGAALSWTVPVFIQQTCTFMHAQALDSALQAGTGRDHPVLVVIQLAGGNDGLNTIIPFEDDLYFKAWRIQIRIDHIFVRLKFGRRPRTQIKSSRKDGLVDISIIAAAAKIQLW